MRQIFTDFVWGLTGEAQEMLVENGRVVWRGAPGVLPKGPDAKNWSGGTQHLASIPPACTYVGPQRQTISLNGKRVYPGFIDCHCHVLPFGLSLKEVDLSSCTTREGVLDRLRDEHQRLEPGKWLQAGGYNQNRFPDGRHLTLSELDAITSTRPILVSHVSGHASIANSAALLAAGVGPETPNPSGGEFCRDATGNLNGLVLENACDKIAQAAPKPTLEEMADAILLAAERMANDGISCASDMMTGYYDLPQELEAYWIASERGARTRFRLFVQWSALFGPKAVSPDALADLTAKMDRERCRIAGVKIFADGALSSRTAAIYGAFEGSEPEHGDWSGHLIYKKERLQEMVLKAEEAGYAAAIHSLGDYATDVMLDVLEEVGSRRHRLEHAMMLNDRQIERLARLGTTCTLQPEFLLRLGEAYRRNLGEPRAAKLNRCRSLLSAGVRVGFSSDRPVVAGNPWDGIRSAVQRPKGFDPSENITEREAILAYTAGAADANEDTGVVGRLAPGEWADFCTD